MARLMDHDEVFERVALLLATLLLLLFLGNFWALNRAFGSIMPKKGGCRGTVGWLRLEHRGQGVGRTSRKQLLIR